MENKLELKEIVAYLPYRLKVYVFDKPKFLIEYLKICPNGNWAVELTFENFKEHIFKSGYKPILFPLDCLTKKIEVNGEKIVPIKKLYDYCLTIGIKDYDAEFILRSVEGKIMPLHTAPYFVSQKLLEWKVDIFGLIEKGLAIPVTEEFNPYK